MKNILNKIRVILLAAVFVVFLAVPVLAEPGVARIDRVLVTTTPSLNLSFTVRDAFTEEIEVAIKSGIQTSFTYIVELSRVRSLWFDSSIESWSFKHTVKYDSLKEEYEVTLDEKGKQVIRTKDFNEAKRLMTTGEEIDFLPPPVLIRGKRHELRMMAELDTIELPFLLRHMLFFVKYWDFETEWFITWFIP